MILFYADDDVTIKHECAMECEQCKAETALPDGLGKVGVLLDRCVMPDVAKLWEAGVKTVCSCCGHGNEEAAFIVVEDGETERMKSLGYSETKPLHDHCAKCGVAYKPKQVAEEMMKRCTTLSL